MPKSNNFPQLFTPAKPMDNNKPESIYDTPRDHTISYPFQN